MVVINISCSILFYYVIFPAMENANWNDGIVFGVSGIYFGCLVVLFYFLIEPALIDAFSKSGRHITQGEGKVMINIMNAVLFVMTLTMYVLFTRRMLIKKNANKKSEPEPKITGEQTAQLLKLLKANQIE